MHGDAGALDGDREPREERLRGAGDSLDQDVPAGEQREPDEVIAASPDDIEYAASQFRAAAKATGVADAWLRAIAHAESGFRADAVSNKGAQGLMQLIPATASRFGVVDAFDPGQNIRGGLPRPARFRGRTARQSRSRRRRMMPPNDRPATAGRATVAGCCSSCRRSDGS